ncbi:MAG: DUF4269 domain-containing protein [Bacillota bacterium]|uniref:DUF4269 domain-containing protein n=1 Tax=Virgibacillus salarius TaxID=447199 RepID=A0A941DVP6_9BACI|nr:MULTISPECIES: DUF4269 domain-containing protein [Bacillaceae]NAZ09066.1 DUF4269 domain-containing protein [Agaribacter marinus]MBR7796357.1 DUF4269 domain-containing protein [Virgibacillus salarius]MCC2251835.1 DUF4269 domain-containing protein [Virgibacillus sp. AGTR]MDY7045469.1 DUF4269 domain-containing protein [Virgibacillus sp. M23]QRZ20159.1 DUF4269 domain-containing protein [Virgibacillus sp. AGTR]
MHKPISRSKHSLDRLKFGDWTQKCAFKAIENINIMEDLQQYTPFLCGTFPLGIHTEASDLDIIVEAQDLSAFAEKIRSLYGGFDAFSIKRKKIRNHAVVKANFLYQDFEFELFGQAQPVHQQYAYLHLIIEDYLLQSFPSLKPLVKVLKENGFNTEEAFCELLGLDGNPFEQLIHYGKRIRII